MDAALAGDEIILRLPAEPPFAHVARVCAGALAARLGFAYAQVEDLRLAVDEAWLSLLGEGNGRGRTIELGLAVLANGLAVDLHLDGRRSIHIERHR